jgi:hypothetical protein
MLNCYDYFSVLFISCHLGCYSGDSKSSEVYIGFVLTLNSISLF